MYAVILLKMVMVSPGTHLVKNDEFQCKANESQFKNQPVVNLKCWGLYMYVIRQLI